MLETSASGREIALYRVRPGGACVISMSAVLSGSAYPASVEPPIECEAGLSPRPFASEPEVQRMFVQHLSSLSTEIMSRVAEVAFRRVDPRRARFLLDAVSGCFHYHAAQKDRDSIFSTWQ